MLWWWYDNIMMLISVLYIYTAPTWTPSNPIHLLLIALRCYIHPYMAFRWTCKYPHYKENLWYWTLLGANKQTNVGWIGKDHKTDLNGRKADGRAQEMVTNGDIQGVLKVFQEGFKPKLFHENIHKLYHPVSISIIIIIMKIDVHNFQFSCWLL